MSKITHERRGRVITKLAVSEDLLNEAGAVVGRQMVSPAESITYQSINEAKRVSRIEHGAKGTLRTYKETRR